MAACPVAVQVGAEVAGSADVCRSSNWLGAFRFLSNGLRSPGGETTFVSSRRGPRLSAETVNSSGHPTGWARPPARTTPVTNHGQRFQTDEFHVDDRKEVEWLTAR